MDDNERIELWAESVIFSEDFFARLQGDEDNPPDLLGAAMSLKDAFVDTSIQWLKDNPEEAIVAFFGMDKYRECKIDPAWITTAYDDASLIAKAADYGFAVRDLVDSLGKISGITNKDTQEYRDAMGNLGSNFLNLTSMLVGEIPLLGDFYSNIVDAIRACSHKSLDKQVKKC